MNIIDLTFMLENGIPCFNNIWHQPFHIQPLGRINTVGRNTSRLLLGSHTGTHIDASFHFFEGGGLTGQIPLALLCGDVEIVDFRHLPPGTAVTKEMFHPFPLSERMLVLFGWCWQWRTGAYYHDYPYFTKGAAQFLVDGGVRLLGMDTPSPDSSSPTENGEDSPIHKLFLEQGVTLIEYLAGTQEINTTKAYKIYALPLKINSDGAPARVILEEVES